MPPIEVGAPRAIGAVSAEIARKSGADINPAAAAVPTADTSAAAAAKPTVATSATLDPGEAPINTDRVAQIRKAVESGNYPLVPARIADAMIAAGMFLRSGNA
ncbi:negative regulator of flagellin synthesis FlgM [Novosphingobium chloroacetimidivorans]|uniref:Negative regulator of flagellin synthesis FlgM n=1 Tax=Novosphingobium chloroacetimidivorans TaxID=1428314 RepID=A0A7W7K8D2_9SPHN|nr:flagellar biosynthesis anti-sigma factor FlgM [Novosphingobium chloroacetimidivorans]MBB4858134.1 negative regulator of flagellin synthesis FlgM [Novosphingobium chloroacetimidivorans]